jgi:hypothetical protein
MLVLNNKRVAAIWRRVDGLAWAQEVFECLGDVHRVFPYARDGRMFSDCICRFASVLQKYGSPQLARDLTILKRALKPARDKPIITC